MDAEASPVAGGFGRKFGAPTPAQSTAWPLIEAGRNVLVVSPTGTGKTFAAFFQVLDPLAREHVAGTLREGVHCLYLSPLRALGHDLEKNLAGPLREIYGDAPPIRVGLRSAAVPIVLRTVAQVPPLSFGMDATQIKEALLVEDPRETLERLYRHGWTKIEGDVPGAEPAAPA